MAQKKITKEQFLNSINKSTTTARPTQLFEYLKTKGAITESEAINMLWPDDQRPHEFKKNSLASVLSHARKKYLAGISKHEGMIVLEAYWDENKGEPVYINK